MENELLKKEIKEKKFQYFSQFFYSSVLVVLEYIIIIKYWNLFTLSIKILLYFVLSLMIIIILYNFWQFLSKKKMFSLLEQVEYTLYEKAILENMTIKFHSITNKKITILKVSKEDNFLFKLRGFSAMYEPSSKTIIYPDSTDFSVFEGILAHELGHAVTSENYFTFMLSMMGAIVPSMVLLNIIKLVFNLFNRNKLTTIIQFFFSVLVFPIYLLNYPIYLVIRLEEYRANKLSLLFSDGYNLLNYLFPSSQKKTLFTRMIAFNQMVFSPDHNAVKEFHKLQSNFDYKYDALKYNRVDWIGFHNELFGEFIPYQVIFDWIISQENLFAYYKFADYEFSHKSYRNAAFGFEKVKNMYMVFHKLGECYFELKEYHKALINIIEYAKISELSEKDDKRLKTLLKLNASFKLVGIQYYSKDIEKTDYVEDLEDYSSVQFNFKLDQSSTLVLDGVISNFLIEINDTDQIKIKLQDREFKLYIRDELLHSSLIEYKNDNNELEGYYEEIYEKTSMEKKENSNISSLNSTSS